MSCFHNYNGRIGQNHRLRVRFVVEFARWRHQSGVTQLFGRVRQVPPPGRQVVVDDCWFVMFCIVSTILHVVFEQKKVCPIETQWWYPALFRLKRCFHTHWRVNDPAKNMLHEYLANDIRWRALCQPIGLVIHSQHAVWAANEPWTKPFLLVCAYISITIVFRCIETHLT